MLEESKLNKLLHSCSSEVLKAYNDVITAMVYSSYSSLLWSEEPVDVFSVDKKCKPYDREKIAKSLEQYRQALMSIIQRGITLAVMQSANVQQRALAGFTRMEGSEVGAWRDEVVDAFTQGRMKRFGGLNLSDRVWNYTQQTKAEFELAVSQALEKGIASGMDAETLGRRVRQYLNNPDMMYRRYHLKKVMSDGTKKDVVEWRRRVIDENGKMHFVKEDLANVGTGVYRSARQNALRLTITETNMAYNYANCKRWSEEPFVLGIRIRLSGNHPEKDICDELQGDYPVDFDFPGWHPRCRCTMSSILIDRKSEEWKHLRSLPADEYAKYQSPNRIKEYPDAFKKWCEDNKKKLTKARKEKKLPYFVRNNEKAVGEIVGWNNKPTEMRDTITPERREQILKSAELRHKNRKAFEIMVIQSDWQDRRRNLVLKNARIRHKNRTADEIRRIQDMADIRIYGKTYIDNVHEIEKRLGIKRGKRMNHQEANSGHVNPHYYEGKKWRINCSTCSGTYILRRMGFDVEAKANTKENYLNYYLSRGNSWEKWKGGPSNYHATDKWMEKNKFREMNKERYIQFLNEYTQEPGIYEWSVGWETGGHSTLLERTSHGDLISIDQQLCMDFVKASDRFERWLESATKNPTRNRGVLRVDNAMFNPEFANIVMIKKTFE